MTKMYLKNLLWNARGIKNKKWEITNYAKTMMLYLLLNHILWI